MKIRPFVYVDGIPTMRDSDLRTLFEKMVRDGTDKTVFYDGMVRTWVNFIEFIKLPGNMLFVAYDKNEVSLGCGWVNNFKNATAEAHFCIFKEGWPHSVEIGKALVEKIMASLELKMVVGNIPKFNTLALEFVQKCGAKLLGELPFGGIDRDGRLHPMVIVYYER